MSLFATFLARVPPGGPRGSDWAKRVAALHGVGFVVGDYDMHQLVKVSRDVPLEVGELLAGVAPDFYTTLLSAEPNTSADRLVDGWANILKEHSLFCYLEIRLAAILLSQVAMSHLPKAVRFIEQAVCSTVPRLPVQTAGFVSLGSPDVVFYLFGDDYEAFFDVVVRIRQLTLRSYASWLFEQTGPDAEGCAQLAKQLLDSVQEIPQNNSVPFAVGNEGAIPERDLTQEDQSAPAPNRHLCRNTYTVFGTLPFENPGQPEFERTLFNRVPERTRTTLRPVIFIATYPGHEGDPDLFRILNDPKHERTKLTSGLFDLFHEVVATDETDLTQRQVLERTFSLLTILWGQLGPTSPNATIVRTNTVFRRAGALELPLLRPHRRPAKTPVEGLDVTVNIDRIPSVAPSLHLYRGLLSAFRAASTNEVNFTHVRGIEPSIRSLHDGLMDHVDWLKRQADLRERKRLDEAAEAEAFSRTRKFEKSFAAALVRVQAAFSDRTYCTTHSLREEIVAHPGASFQKLLTAYGTICRQNIEELKGLFDGRTFPEILFTLGGIETAQSYSYFQRDDGMPRLVVIEVPGRNLLRPALVIFPLMHELMHVIDYDKVNLPLAGEILTEAASLVVDLYLKMGGQLEGEQERGGLVTQVRTSLLVDYDELCLAGERTYAEARRILDWCVSRASYLARLFLVPSMSHGGPPTHLQMPLLNCEQVALLDQLAAVLEIPLTLLRSEYKECRADVMAAFATEPKVFLEALRQLEGPTELGKTRVKVLEAVISRIEHPEAEARSEVELRPIVNGLAAIAREVHAHRKHSSPSVFQSLATDLCEMDSAQLSTLLSFCGE